MRSKIRPSPSFSRLPIEDRRGGSSAEQPASATAADELAEPLIVCRTCGDAITRTQEALTVAGAHRHTFANLHGIVFEIACFHTAPGCAHVGRATDDFTWFAGYRWRIAICGGCHEHLGWRYESAGGEGFHGLIVDRLIFPS